jgi:hypothetical protein
MAESNEKTFLQEGLVKVTDRKTIIGTITYPMTGITSANVTRQARSRKSLWLVAAGIPFLLWGLIDQTSQFMEFFNIGLFLIVLGTVLLIVARPTYAVHIGGSGRDQSILRSTDQSFVQRIVDAMNHARARNG